MVPKGHEAHSYDLGTLETLDLGSFVPPSFDLPY